MISTQAFATRRFSMAPKVLSFGAISTSPNSLSPAATKWIVADQNVLSSTIRALKLYGLTPRIWLFLRRRRFRERDGLSALGAIDDNYNVDGQGCGCLRDSSRSTKPRSSSH